MFKIHDRHKEHRNELFMSEECNCNVLFRFFEVVKIAFDENDDKKMLLQQNEERKY